MPNNDEDEHHKMNEPPTDRLIRIYADVTHKFKCKTIIIDTKRYKSLCHYKFHFTSRIGNKNFLVHFLGKGTSEMVRPMRRKPWIEV